MYQELSERWARQGHKVYLLSGKGKKPAPKGVILFKLPFIRAKYFQRLPFPSNEFEGLSLLPFVLLYLVAIKPDIVLSMSAAETLPSLILRYPSVMMTQAFIGHRFNTCKKANLVIANDPFSFRTFKAMSLENVKFIYLGTKIADTKVNMETTRAQHKIPLEGLVILTVARLHPQKRIHLLIEAFRMIKQKATLLIVGEGPELSRLRSMVPRDLENRVIFLGGLPHDKVLELYQICDVFTLPDELVYGGWFGFVHIEAISLGKPVVTTPSYNRKLWLSPFAIFTNVENPSVYAQALVAAASRKIDTNGIEFRKFKEKFDWEHISSRFIRAFNDVLRKRRLK